jgi:hypothetical protein
MTRPLIVDLPHKLGAVEAKRRISGGIGRLKDQIPGGGEVRSGWSGDRLDLAVTAMGQEVTARIDVQEHIVRLEVTLPGVLSFFGSQVEALIRRRGGALLEDKRS